MSRPLSSRVCKLRGSSSIQYSRPSGAAIEQHQRGVASDELEVLRVSGPPLVIESRCAGVIGHEDDLSIRGLRQDLR